MRKPKKTKEQTEAEAKEFADWCTEMQKMPGGLIDTDLKERQARRQFALFHLMKDGGWFTLEEVHKATGYPSATASAGIRDFRKEKFGSNQVILNYLGHGVYQYKLIINQDNNILMRMYGKPLNAHNQ